MYLYRLAKFQLVYCLMVEVHYVLGFVILLVVYWRLLARIRRMKVIHSELRLCWKEKLNATLFRYSMFHQSGSSTQSQTFYYSL